MSSKPLHCLCLLLAVLTAGACAYEEPADREVSMVVEAWIEDGHFPVVKMSRPVDLDQHYQSLDSLERYILRWQWVSVSDGEREVVLTGKYDKHYFPPYIYTTTSMRGQAGHTYTLTIRQPDGPDIVSTTTIPEVARVDSFVVERIAGSDSLCQLVACTSIPRHPTTYYRVFARTDRESQDYLSSFLGVLSSDMIPDDGRVYVNRGRTNLVKGFTPYFTVGDTVAVRFARIDSLAFEYWRNFEDMLSLSRIPLFPTTNSMPSNVPGAYGYWQGMGSSYHVVAIEP